MFVCLCLCIFVFNVQQVLTQIQNVNGSQIGRFEQIGLNKSLDDMLQSGQITLMEV